MTRVAISCQNPKIFVVTKIWIYCNYSKSGSKKLCVIAISKFCFWNISNVIFCRTLFFCQTVYFRQTVYFSRTVYFCQTVFFVGPFTNWPFYSFERIGMKIEFRPLFSNFLVQPIWSNFELIDRDTFMISNGFLGNFCWVFPGNCPRMRTLRCP